MEEDLSVVARKGAYPYARSGDEIVLYETLEEAVSKSGVDRIEGAWILDEGMLESLPRDYKPPRGCHVNSMERFCAAHCGRFVQFGLGDVGV